MKKIIKRILAVFLAIIAVASVITGVFAYNLFIGGKEIAPELVVVDTVEVSDNRLHVKGTFGIVSAEAYRGYKYKIDGENAYITIKSVLVSDLYRYADFDITIKDDFSEIKNVYVVGAGDEKLIWPKSDTIEDSLEVDDDKWGKPLDEVEGI